MTRCTLNVLLLALAALLFGPMATLASDDSGTSLFDRMFGDNEGQDGGAARLTWTPGTEVSAVMRCEAGGLNDMRMFTVGTQ
ncbi:TPA: hypothetical protein ACGR1C_004253 [Escherichia coli]